jgi:hypothetical protein
MEIYVSVDGRSLQVHLAAHAAKWIEAASYYEFPLYNSDHSEFLAKMIVTRTGNKNDC